MRGASFRVTGATPGHAVSVLLSRTAGTLTLIGAGAPLTATPSDVAAAPLAIAASAQDMQI